MNSHRLDARRRRNGTCAKCGKKIPRPQRVQVDRVVYESDPFCSTDCCKRHYGVTFGFTKHTEAQLAQSREQAVMLKARYGDGKGEDDGDDDAAYAD